MNTADLVLLTSAILALLPTHTAGSLPELTVRAGEGDPLDPEAPGWSRAVAVRWGPPAYATTFRAMRTPAGLAVRFDAVDPDPWHTMTERDSPLWEQEVVEIFIDPDGDGRDYAEVEINPANVVTDLRMRRGEPDKIGEIEWDFPGLRSRVVPLAGGEGWTALALLPWSGFAALEGGAVALPPAPGDAWRFNVFRIKRPGGPQDPRRDVVLAAWSPPPGKSFHVPEVFGWMRFE